MADRRMATTLTAQPSPAGQHSGWIIPDDARIVGVIADSIERGKLDHPGFYRNTQLGQVLRRVLSAALSARQPVGRSFQAGVADWMGQCFLPSLYSNMTERGDRLLEEVLELLQAHGYDRARVPTLVDYVFGRPVGEPAQEVGGVMVTLAGYCWVAGLDMHAAGDAELARISQPEVVAKIRAKQEAKNALQFDTPLPGNAAEPMFYLQDRRQYVGNCPLWWAIGGAGYTTRIDQAQRYTRAEAYDQNRTRDTDVPWPCEQIDALVRPTIDYQDLRRLPREEVQP